MADKDNKGTGSKTSILRPRLYVDDKTMAMLTFWADKNEVSTNQYILEAIWEKLDRENGKYPVPDIMVQRVNQLIDSNKEVVTTLSNLVNVTLHTQQMFTNLTRGGSYLDDLESGEL